MGWLRRTVSASEPSEKAARGASRTVRRVEITLEREVCRFEVHRAGQVGDEAVCPACGRELSRGQLLPEDKDGAVGRRGGAT